MSIQEAGDYVTYNIYNHDSTLFTVEHLNMFVKK